MKLRLLLLLALAFVVVIGSPAAFAQTATPTATSTSTPTHTPNLTRNDTSAQRAAELDRSSTGRAVKLGSRLLALWHGRQTGCTPTADSTNVDIAACKAMVNGVYVAEDGQDNLALTGISTTSVQFRKVAICMTDAGVYTPRAGAVAASQAAALIPVCDVDEVEVAYLELPASFTGASTSLTAAMVKQRPGRATQLGNF